jgi:uncharacterized damage-inducible protein DinB
MPSEVWQRGAVPGYEPLLMPVVHSFLQVKEEVERLSRVLDDDLLWQQRGHGAAIGYHLRHLAGSTDRLLTYARGDSLTPDQLSRTRRERTERRNLAAVIDEVNTAIDRALEQVQTTAVASLLEERKVGRARLPSTVLGLLFHAAEHATRHAGQALTTALVLGAPRPE